MFLTNLMVEKASLEELKDEIRLIVMEAFASQNGVFNEETNLIMTRNEVRDMLDVSFVTLNKWNKLGVLPAFNIGNRVYYNSEDVKSAMKRIP